MAQILNFKNGKQAENSRYRLSAGVIIPIAKHTKTRNKFRKEVGMKAKNCCKTMEAELSAWKANVYDIVRKMEELPHTDRDRFLPNIEDLHILIAEMDDRIEQIRQNCSPETGIDDIRTERQQFDKSLSTLRVKADEAMRILGAGDFGG